MKLTVCLASRGRPDLLLETVKRTAANMVLANTTILICLDTDDKDSFARATVINDKPASIVGELKAIDKRVVVSVAQREDSRGEKYDRAFTLAPADIYLPICDYAPIITPGFDKTIVEAAQIFPDGIGVVYTTMANMSFPHYLGVTARLAKMLGYTAGPHFFPFWFIDHWVDDIARMIGRISNTAVDVELMLDPDGSHKTIGLRDVAFWALLYDVGRVEREREALRVIDSPEFQEPEHRKTLLRNDFERHHHRSWHINEGVRQKAKFIENSRGGVESQPDERYQRIKAKADELMAKWGAELRAEAAAAPVAPGREEAHAEMLKESEELAPTTMSAEKLKDVIEQLVPGLVEPVAKPKGKAICLALLAYDARVHTRTMMAITNFIVQCAQRGWGFMIIIREGDSMVARGRSLLASQFLENPGCAQCTDFVQIDTDLAWDGDELVRLCEHDVDVIGAAYPYKDESGDFPLRWPAEGLYEEKGLWRVNAVTPGFCRISRRALEKIAQEMPWLEFRDKANAKGQRCWMFFDNIQRPGGVYDEGYVFCERWRQAGGHVYLDPNLTISHIGNKAFNHGSLRQWLERKSKNYETLESEFPGIPPLKIMKAVMEKADPRAELTKIAAEEVAPVPDSGAACSPAA